MAKENPNIELEAAEDASSEVVSKAQYDALAKQFQDVVTEANRRISLLEADKKTLTAALASINKLVDKLTATEDK